MVLLKIYLVIQNQFIEKKRYKSQIFKTNFLSYLIYMNNIMPAVHNLVKERDPIFLISEGCY
jgi:hypothetical protein